MGKQIFERNITVYAKVPKRELPPCEALPGVGGGSLTDVSTTQLPTCNDNDKEDDDETGRLCSTIIRYPCTMYVGLYENHFF